MKKIQIYFPIRLALTLVVTSAVLVGCQSKYGNASKRRIHDEEVAVTLLNQARQQMNAGQYEEARKSVRLLRDSCRYALDGREQGILLLDSIELLMARADTTIEDYAMRERFYLKKLDHDKKAQLKAKSDE